MTTATARTRRPLADRLRSATADAPDVASVARAVFTTVASDVRFAFACLATTDPTSGLITRAYKSAPLPLGDEEFVASEYGEPDLNQFVDIVARPVPVGVLSLDTDGHPERCARLRDYMTPRFGFVDEVRLACRVDGTTWAAFACYRRAGEPFFTADEGRVLAGAHEVVAEAVRTALFADAGAGVPGSRIPVVVVVDAADRVTGMSAAAEELVEDLGGWDHGALPAGVLAVAASARSKDALAQSTVRGRSGGWLTVQGLPLTGSAGERSVVLTVARASAAAVGTMAVVARGLTRREQDVVGLVVQGASTKAIAAALHLSPHTVQDHLKAVFAKLEVNSRRDLVARLSAA